MKFAIAEFTENPVGADIDFSCVLAEELIDKDYEAEFYLPESYRITWKSNVNINYIPTKMIYSDEVNFLEKLFLSFKNKVRRQTYYKYLYSYSCQNKFDAIIFPSADYTYLQALRKSALQRSKVPLIFLLHNITKSDAKKLKKEIKYFKLMPNIKLISIDDKNGEFAPYEAIIEKIENTVTAKSV